MINHRGSALNLFLSRPKNLKERENKKISSYYAENVFTDAKLRSYLSNDAYKAYNQSIEQGQKSHANWQIKSLLHSSLGQWRKVPHIIHIGFNH